MNREETAILSIANVFAGLAESPLILLFSVVFFVLLFGSYVKIATVLSIVRFGFGQSGLPGVVVTGTLAVVLSLFVVYPSMVKTAEILDSHNAPKGLKISPAGIVEVVAEWKKFLKLHADEELVEEFSSVARKIDEVGKSSDLIDRLSSGFEDPESVRVLAPAFLVTELREAFATGLSLFMPFLLVELLVANILTAVGVVQLNSSIISLPFKILLFVLVDGWGLIATNLVASYGG